MTYTRRDFLVAAGTAASVLVVPRLADASDPPEKRHIITLSFDDGFRKSFLRTAEIYEKFKLPACLNVVAAWLSQDADGRETPFGDFKLWNDLQKRGHEIMPHGYKHENLQKVSFDEGKDIIRRCLDVFDKETQGLRPQAGDLQLPVQRLDARTGKVVADAGTSLQDWMGADQSAAAQRTSETNLCQFRAWQQRSRHRPGDRQVVGEGIRLADLQYARSGRRRLGADSGELPGAALGKASGHQVGGDSASGKGVGQVRLLKDLPRTVLGRRR